MGNLSGAVGHLKKELVRAQQEVQQFYCRTRSFGKLRLKRAANYDMRFTSVKYGETRVLRRILR